MNLRRICLFFLVSACGSAVAEVRLPHSLSDHAVLQRDRPIHIWGWASPNENVTVTFHGQSVSAKANAAGAWECWLGPEAAGGPYIMLVKGDQSAQSLQRTDMLVGDVWVASGQSNMEFTLSGFTGAPLKNAEKEIADAMHPTIRMLVQKHALSAVQLGEQNEVWSQCTPETAKHFSAIAYFFARELVDRKGIPIGIIEGACRKCWSEMLHVRAVCAAAPEPLDLDEIMRRVIADGYKPRSKRPEIYLLRKLRSNEQFVESVDGWMIRVASL